MSPKEVFYYINGDGDSKPKLTPNQGGGNSASGGGNGDKEKKSGGKGGRDKEKTGRGKNNLEYDENAVGPHTAIKRNQKGEITTYATYKPNGPKDDPKRSWQPSKRVDLVGKAHNGIETPHVQIKRGSVKSVRPARSNEIPKHLKK